MEIRLHPKRIFEIIDKIIPLFKLLFFYKSSCFCKNAQEIYYDKSLFQLHDIYLNCRWNDQPLYQSLLPCPAAWLYKCIGLFAQYYIFNGFLNTLLHSFKNRIGSASSIASRSGQLGWKVVGLELDRLN